MQIEIRTWTHCGVTMQLIQTEENHTEIMSGLQYGVNRPIQCPICYTVIGRINHKFAGVD